MTASGVPFCFAGRRETFPCRTPLVADEDAPEPVRLEHHRQPARDVRGAGRIHLPSQPDQRGSEPQESGLLRLRAPRLRAAGRQDPGAGEPVRLPLAAGPGSDGDPGPPVPPRQLRNGPPGIQYAEALRLRGQGTQEDGLGYHHPAPLQQSRELGQRNGRGAETLEDEGGALGQGLHRHLLALGYRDVHATVGPEQGRGHGGGGRLREPGPAGHDRGRPLRPRSSRGRPL